MKFPLSLIQTFSLVLLNKLVLTSDFQWFNDGHESALATTIDCYEYKEDDNEIFINMDLNNEHISVHDSNDDGSLMVIPSIGTPSTDLDRVDVFTIHRSNYWEHIERCQMRGM